MNFIVEELSAEAFEQVVQLVMAEKNRRACRFSEHLAGLVQEEPYQRVLKWMRQYRPTDLDSAQCETLSLLFAELAKELGAGLTPSTR